MLAKVRRRVCFRSDCNCRKSLPETSCAPERSRDDALAEEIRKVQEAGKLASDDLVIRVVQDRTAQPDCANGYVLDGFPRTPAQAEMLERLAAEQGNTLAAILIDVPAEFLEKRATGRRSCPVCGEIYNIYFKPPRREGFCDFHPEAVLLQRADDTEDKIRVRLATYNEQTKPLIDYYDKTGRLHRVDGTQDQETIHREIRNILMSS